MSMPKADFEYDLPLCVLDTHGQDRLLDRQRWIHGESRPDIAPAVRPTTRKATPMCERALTAA